MVSLLGSFLLLGPTLLQGVSEEELGRLFSQYGNLLTKKLLRDQGGKNKGIAFVRWGNCALKRCMVMIAQNYFRFSKKSEAETAIAHLHGHFFQGLIKLSFPL